ncbi:MAG: hypothetical protein V4717_05275 [Bacteroidota bacterium]
MMRLGILIMVLVSCKPLPAQTELTTSVDTLKAGNTTITFNNICTGEQKGIQFIHVHENEQTAADAAKKMLVKYNRGCFVSWQSMADRYVSFKLDTANYKFDPNRIYTLKGRKETLTSNGKYSREADSITASVANAFLEKYINNHKLVIALHNNTDGGGLTINSFKKGGPYAMDAKSVYVNNANDEDDFFLTTDSSIYKFIKSKGYNVLLQDNENVTDDGSLSVYAATKKIAYLNIEAQHGHLQQQLEMMDLVQEMINKLY